MASLRNDLQRVTLHHREPENVSIQGAVPPGLWDGCQFIEQHGQSTGVFYTQPIDRPLRGPFTTGCWRQDSLCYETYMQTFRTDQVVQVWLQQECTTPLTLKQVAAGSDTTYALLTDGSVLCAGRGLEGQADCYDWSGVDIITADGFWVCGVGSGGVRFAGHLYHTSHPDGPKDPLPYMIPQFEDCVQINGQDGRIIGAKPDGSVAHIYWMMVNSESGGPEHDYYGIATDVQSWSGVVKAVCMGNRALGLRSDGTVLVAGGDCGVSSWSGIVDVAVTDYASHGLRADGTVVSCGSNIYELIDDPDTWENISSIYGGHSSLIGVKNNTQRSVVYAGQFPGCGGPSPFADWSNIQECAVSDRQHIGRTTCRAFVCGADTYGAATGAEALFNYCIQE